MQASRPDWRKAGLAATTVGLNAGAIALLSLTDLGPRNRPLRSEPMIVYLDEAWPRLARAPQAAADVADRPASATPPRDMTPATRNDSPGSEIAETAPASAHSTSSAEDDAIDAKWRVGSVTPRSNGAILSCDAPQRLSPDARRRCEERWAGRENARAIAGTGNEERDATFAPTRRAPSGRMGGATRHARPWRSAVRTAQSGRRL